MPFFSRYVVRDKDILGGANSASVAAEARESAKYEDIDLWEGLDPENSMTDRLILYEVAKRRYPGTETDANFSDTEGSNSDGDMSGEFSRDEPPPPQNSSILNQRSNDLNST